jgi:hypothetical protein
VLWLRSALRSLCSRQVDRAINIQLALTSVSPSELAQRSFHCSTLGVVASACSARDGQEFASFPGLARGLLALDRAVELA